jgi:peptidyl-prolyl cis-trans isomerase B (cyclophilin B)
VPPTRDRQRAAARAKLERDMAARAEAARLRRRRNSWIAGIIAGVLVVGGGIWIGVAASGGGKKKPAAAAASATAAPAACAWTPDPNPTPSPSPTASVAPNPNLKNVGTPPASGEPRSGTRDLTFDTNLGTIVVQLNLAHAPCTSESFAYLAAQKFLNNTSCHRLLNTSTTDSQGAAQEYHVLQCGDPSGTGQGGPTYTFADENLPVNQRPAYPEGVVAMANSGQNTNGSQFFFVFGDSTFDPNYTIFGKITQGLDLIKQVGAAGDDEAFATNADGSQGAGGGHPKKALTFKTVTIGPVQTGTPSPTPTASATPSPSKSS